MTPPRLTQLAWFLRGRSDRKAQQSYAGAEALAGWRSSTNIMGAVVIFTLAFGQAGRSHWMATEGTSVLEGAVSTALKRGWPGIAVLIETADGKVTTAVGGFSSIETNTPITASTPFHMCSINKVLTATLVLRLVDQGRLALDQKVLSILDQHVVGRIPNVAAITVSQLLDHSSGIYPTNNDPAYLDTLIGSEAFSGRVWRPEKLVELATHSQNRPQGNPGEGSHYSDTNYVLLGMIVERVSGEAFKAHMARTLLRPLGMKATYFYSDVLEGKRQASPNLANGYIRLTPDLAAAISNSGFKSPRQGWLNMSVAAERLDAAGGLVTTLPDLRRFASALFCGKLLSSKSMAALTAVRAEMTTDPIGKRRTKALQGAMTRFGLVLYKEGDGPGGFNTLMAFHPRTGAIFIGFTNQFGEFNEVEVMMDAIMGVAIPQESAARPL